MFYAQMTSGARLVDAVASINRFLCSRVAGQKYATLLAAQLHRDGKLALVNCGHVPAILAQDGKVTHVEDGDMPVGLISEVDFHVIERELPAGSRLCILTDGISETENAEGAEFGMPYRPLAATAKPRMTAPWWCWKELSSGFQPKSLNPES